jgi:cellulose synthase/poly-beta-1,6-N-acetylglucosamine synthase-like glycosyltransferase
LDADTLVHPGYFQVVRRRLAEDSKHCEKKNKKPIGVLCGNPKSLPHNWLTAWRAYQYFLADFIHKPGQAAFGGITVAPGCASTYSSGVLSKVHWTADTPTEDMDVTIQAALLGERVVYENKAIVFTQDPRNIKDYIGQVAKRWDTGAWQIMRKYNILFSRPFGRVNWECRISMVLEPAAFFVSVYWMWDDPKRLMRAVMITFLTTFCFAALAAYKEKRLDIILFASIYPFMWFIDFTLFLWTSTNLITGPKFHKNRDWYSVERYEMEKQLK